MLKTLPINVILFWPYFGFYSSSYYQYSIVGLLLYLFSISQKDYQTFAVIAGIYATISFVLGQFLYGIDLSAVREILRIMIWILAFGIGYKYSRHFPYLFSLVIMTAILFISKIFHPLLPWISAIWAIAPEFDDSYHYFRTITFGGMPATSGYVFSFVAVFGTLMYQRNKITGYKLILGYLLVSILTFTTLSRLTLIYFVLINISLLCLDRQILIRVFTISIITIFSIIILVDNAVLVVPERWSSSFTAQHRLGTIPYIFNVLNENPSRIFPGCLFNRDCHFDGTIRSISTDGGLLYLILNWGFPIISLLILTKLLLGTYFFLQGRYEFGLILFSGLIFSLFDPVMTDPKVSCLWFFLLGYTFANPKVHKVLTRHSVHRSDLSSQN